MPVEVYVAVGSNVEAVRNLRWGLEQMRRRFGPLRLSPVFRNAPVGFDGDDFYNLVVGFATPSRRARWPTLSTRWRTSAGAIAAACASGRARSTWICCSTATS